MVLLLAAPCAPPSPFTADATSTRWTLAVDAALPPAGGDAEQPLALFPTLVTVGHAAEQPSELTLVDLEGVGSAALHGDRAAVQGLLAWIAGELAHNAWSEWLTVTVCGFGEELPALNPERITYTLRGAGFDGAEQQVRDVTASLHAHGQPTTLAGRVRGVAGDSWVPHVLLIGPDAHATGEDLQRLGGLVAVPDRAGGGPALGVVAGVALPGARWDLELGEDGTVELGALGVQVVAQRLDPALVADLAALMRTAQHPADVDVTAAAPPGSSPASTGEQPSAPAPPASSGPPPSSAGTVLTFPAAVPVADPTLDADLRDFLDPASVRPRVAVLGPVGLHPPREQPAHRNPSLTEAIVMLALRRRVGEDQLLEGLWPGGAKKTTLTQALSRARGWLGADPDGQPAVSLLDPATGCYRLSRWVLLDWDLLYRLRTRALTRLEHQDTAAAAADLQAALELVNGPAFAATNPDRYGWLANTGELHHIPSVVVDTAHTLAGLRLDGGDPAGADWAARRAQLADGGVEETPWQDRMRAAHAAGDLAEVSDLIAQLTATREVDVEEELTPDTYALITRLLPHHYGPRTRTA